MRAFYRLNTTEMTTYGIDEFWSITERHGFTPHLLMLQPQEEIIGERYAYYALTRTA